MWAAEIAQTGVGLKRIDALSWLGRATLDIIGQAGRFFLCIRNTCEREVTISTGFNYYFRNLEGGQSELNDAFHTVFTPDRDLTLFQILRETLPLLRSIVSPLSSHSPLPLCLVLNSHLTK